MSPEYGAIRLRLQCVSKRFVLHVQGNRVLPVLEGVDLELAGGDCMALVGPSGAGKSTLLRMIWGSYRCPVGRVLVASPGGEVDVASASDREILALRRDVVGYVSQFLRVVPRVPALDVVAEPLRESGVSLERARERAAHVLDRLGLPERLWHLSPTTFSGGEQQRVNIARGFVRERALLLLDEPTASLDAENRDRVLDLIHEARQRGSAILGIFHDPRVRRAVCTAAYDVASARAA